MPKEIDFVPETLELIMNSPTLNRDAVTKALRFMEAKILASVLNDPPRWDTESEGFPHIDPAAVELLNELGERVKMKYTVPDCQHENGRDCSCVPVALIYAIMSRFTGKTIAQLMDDGCDAKPLG